MNASTVAVEKGFFDMVGSDQSTETETHRGTGTWHTGWRPLQRILTRPDRPGLTTGAIFLVFDPSSRLASHWGADVLTYAGPMEADTSDSSCEIESDITYYMPPRARYAVEIEIGSLSRATPRFDPE